MNKLLINEEVKFENCYGIKKLNHTFNFTTNNNINVIYAKWLIEHFFYKSV